MPYLDARHPLREMKRETAQAICGLRVYRGDEVPREGEIFVRASDRFN